MSKFLHGLIISFYVLVVSAALIVLTYIGRTFYQLPIEERFFHPNYEMLKPSGLIGHGLGIVGTTIIIIGLFGYMARKRFKIFADWGVLKYWLELHIFLCTLGTVLVVFHTSFKFGGLISVGFWSLIVVWVSGLVGRYIYLQIPRSIEGRILSLNELEQVKANTEAQLMAKYKIHSSDIKSVKLTELKKRIANLSRRDAFKIRRIIHKQQILNFRIRHLDRMKTLMNYWHFIHLPFALIMLIIMAIHVGVAVFFGFVWIF